MVVDKETIVVYKGGLKFKIHTTQIELKVMNLSYKI
jgi:hypothetical protein